MRSRGFEDRLDAIERELAALRARRNLVGVVAVPALRVGDAIITAEREPDGVIVLLARSANGPASVVVATLRPNG